jgi:hypothetical protein
MSRRSSPRIGAQSTPISVTAGTTALVSGVAGKRVKVMSYAVVCTAAGTIKFSDGTDLTGAMPFALNGGISCPPGDDPYFSTAAGSGLSIITSGAVEGHLSYFIES